MSNEELYREELARRTCATCACGVYLTREAQFAEGPGEGRQMCCAANPPGTKEIQVQMDVPQFKPDGTPIMINGKHRHQTETVTHFMAFYPVVPPHFRCWQWRPRHVLPGATHWLPERAVRPSPYAGLPPPAGDGSAGGGAPGEYIGGSGAG
jgi:hypothetical protein